MTAPDSPRTPTSAAVMLERTTRRARQIRRRRRAGLASALVLVAAVAVAVPVLVTGGGSQTRQLHVVGGRPTTVSPSTVTPPTSSPGAGSGPSASSLPPVTASTAPPSIGVQPCATSQLTATLTGANGTAGAVAYQLELRNTSSVACTLHGYPGVSYVAGGNGTTVGAPATRSGSTGSTVTLAPGRAAQAPLLETDSLNYPPATCRLTPVDGLRVYPPDQRGALFVAQAGHACANSADNVLQVGPLQPVAG